METHTNEMTEVKAQSADVIDAHATHSDTAITENLSAEERALNFLAKHHPDDDASLQKLTDLLADQDDEHQLEVFYRGLNAEEREAEAKKAAYLKGRNDVIDEMRKAQHNAMPVDDGGHPSLDNPPLLRSIRRSVWD